MSRAARIREFTDGRGLRWSVRRFEPELGPALGGPRPWALVSDAAARGWLTFECAPTGWLRRLAPVPDGWESCDEATLLHYFESARHVRSRGKSGPLP